MPSLDIKAFAKRDGQKGFKVVVIGFSAFSGCGKHRINFVAFTAFSFSYDIVITSGCGRHHFYSFKTVVRVYDGAFYVSAVFELETECIGVICLINYLNTLNCFLVAHKKFIICGYTQRDTIFAFDREVHHSGRNYLRAVFGKGSIATKGSTSIGRVAISGSKYFYFIILSETAISTSGALRAGRSCQALCSSGSLRAFKSALILPLIYSIDININIDTTGSSIAYEISSAKRNISGKLANCAYAILNTKAGAVLTFEGDKELNRNISFIYRKYAEEVVTSDNGIANFDGSFIGIVNSVYC